MRDNNWQPNSVKLVDGPNPIHMDTARFDPYTFLFGIVGDIGEMVQASRNDPSFDGSGLAAMVIASVANNITSKTWLQGIADVIDVLDSKDGPYVAQRWMESRAASMVPFASAGRYINTMTEEHQKEARGYIDRMKSNIPAYSSDLATRYDWIDGEALENPTRLFGYIKARRGDDDPVDAELRRLNYGFTGPDRRVGEVELSSEQYQEWRRLMGGTKIYGKTLKQAMSEIMSTPQYDLNRDRVPDGITTPSESHRVDMIRRVMSQYKQASRGLLFEKYPDLYEAWRAFEEYEGRARAGVAQEGERNRLLEIIEQD